MKYALQIKSMIVIVLLELLLKVRVNASQFGLRGCHLYCVYLLHYTRFDENHVYNLLLLHLFCRGNQFMPCPI